MNLAKTSFFAITQTIAKLLAGFIVIKIIAMMGGPIGIADFGVFQNFSTILLMLSGGVAFTGVTKLIAGAHEHEKQEIIYSTSLNFLKRLIFISFFVILPIMILIQYSFLGYSIKKMWLLIVAAPFIFIQARFNFYLAVLNGIEKVDLLAIRNIISSIGVVLLAGLSYLFLKNWQAVALTLSVAPSLYFLFLSFKSVTRLFQGDRRSDSEISLELRKYSYFGIVSAICIPVAQLIIRNTLTVRFSDHTAGIWQGLNRLSEVYLVLISSVLSIYIVPKISSAGSKEEVLRIVKSTLVYTLLMAICLASGVFITKDILIKILFNKSFLEMNSLFIYQLPGDFFKIISWVFSFSLLAKGHVKQVVILEIVSSALYLALSLLLIERMGVEGSVLAYTISYTVYLILVFSVFIFTVGRHDKVI